MTEILLKLCATFSLLAGVVGFLTDAMCAGVHGKAYKIFSSICGLFALLAIFSGVGSLLCLIWS